MKHRSNNLAKRTIQIRCIWNRSASGGGAPCKYICTRVIRARNNDGDSREFHPGRLRRVACARGGSKSLFFLSWEIDRPERGPTQSQAAGCERAEIWQRTKTAITRGDNGREVGSFAARIIERTHSGDATRCDAMQRNADESIGLPGRRHDKTDHRPWLSARQSGFTSPRYCPFINLWPRSMRLFITRMFRRTRSRAGRCIVKRPINSVINFISLIIKAILRSIHRWRWFSSMKMMKIEPASLYEYKRKIKARWRLDYIYI